jgi:CheY-like chemotaxis protein
MKILMTDDDSEDRLLALFAFKKLNAAHSIDFVSNGQELLDYLYARVESNSELPNLILLDLNMPRMDGREALNRIRSNPKLKNIEVIIYSTSTSEEDKQLTKNLGARDYIIKPSSQRELINIFRKICDDLATQPGWHYFIEPEKKNGRPVNKNEKP